MEIIKSNNIGLHDIIKQAKEKLFAANISNAQKEVEWFLNKKLSISLSQIIIDKNHKLSQKNIIQLNKFITQRLKGKPFQYILNLGTFYGYDFFINKHTLIPRPETELIIDIAKKHGPYNKAIDIGTGSGNIAIVLSKENIAKHIDAIDISKQALDVAKYNGSQYNIKNINYFQLDFLMNDIAQKYDLVVSNPPYISNAEYKKLEEHIKFYEPKIALTDGKNGLMFYKFFAKNLNKILKPKGKAIIEIGIENTKIKIDKLFLDNNYHCTWHKDLNGNYRVCEVNQ